MPIARQEEVGRDFWRERQRQRDRDREEDEGKRNPGMGETPWTLRGSRRCRTGEVRSNKANID